ncbi:16855_t:CDS:2, partial [Acaulospora colombiana]
ENWDTETLVLHLQEQGLKLDDEDFAIIRKEKIVGLDFLDLTEEKFRSYGLAGGPAMRLAKEANALKTAPKRPFSSYHSLKEVLAKYGIDDNRITAIPQFTPDIHKLDDNDEELLHCIKEIKHRLGNMGTVADSNEAMRCSYIESILHASVRIVMHLTEKGLLLIPQLEVSGGESHGRVDYAVKKIVDTMVEDIICVTEGKQNQAGIGIAQNLMQCESSEQTNRRKRKVDEAFRDSYYEYLYGIVSTASDWYFLLYSSEGIWCTSKTEYHISLTESALDDDTDLPES